MIIQNKRFLLLTLNLLLISSLTIGCDKISQLFSSEDTDEPTSVSQETPSKKTSKAKVLPTDGIVRIDDWVLTKGEFQDRLKALKEVLPNFDETNKEARKMVLDEIVSQQLIVNDAKQKGINKKQEILLAVDEFEKTLLVRENAKELVKNIRVTEEDAKAFYDENPDNFKVQEEWRLSEIVVDDQLKANELLLDVMKGDDFADIAQKSSVSQSASKGGDLGFVANVPFFEMANAIGKLEEGEVSNVFQGPEGFYIVKVEEKRGGRLRDFDEVKDQLQKELMVMEQQKAIIGHVENLRKSADIEINEANLE